MDEDDRRADWHRRARPRVLARMCERGEDPCGECRACTKGETMPVSDEEVTAALLSAIEAFERIAPGYVWISWFPADPTIAAQLPEARRVYRTTDGKQSHTVAIAAVGESEVRVFGDVSKGE